jgi:hypothetical protein
MDRRVYVRSKAKVSRTGAVAKASLKMALSCWHMARNPVIYPWAECIPRNIGRRLEAVNVEKFWHDLWGGVKV